MEKGPEKPFSSRERAVAQDQLAKIEQDIAALMADRDEAFAADNLKEASRLEGEIGTKTAARDLLKEQIG